VKRIVVVLLTTVYLLSAIGVSASSFYCCGLLKSTSLSIGDSQLKENNTITKADNCCKTTKQSFKLKDNHFGSGFVSLLAKCSLAPHNSTPVFNLNTKSFTAVYTAFNSHAPPSGQHEPFYTLNCAYRI
jgi:hypothetical protein